MPIIKDLESQVPTEVDREVTVELPGGKAFKTDAFSDMSPELRKFAQDFLNSFVNTGDTANSSKVLGVMERLVCEGSSRESAYTPYQIDKGFRYCAGVFSEFYKLAEITNKLEKMLVSPHKFILSDAEGKAFQERIGSLSYRELLRLYLEYKVARRELEQLISKLGKKRNIQLKDASPFTRAFTVEDGYTSITKDGNLVIHLDDLRKRFRIWQDCSIIILSNLMEYREYYIDFFQPKSVKVAENEDRFSDLEQYVAKVELGPACYVTSVKFPQIAFPSKYTRSVQLGVDVEQETISKTLTAPVEWLYSMDIQQQITEVRQARDNKFFELCSTCTKDVEEVTRVLYAYDSAAGTTSVTHRGLNRSSSDTADEIGIVKIGANEQRLLLDKLDHAALRREVLRAVWRMIKENTWDELEALADVSTASLTSWLQRASSNVQATETFMSGLDRRLGAMQASHYSTSVINSLRYSRELRQRSRSSKDGIIEISIDGDATPNSATSTEDPKLRNLKILKRLIAEYKSQGDESLLGWILSDIAKKKEAIESGQPPQTIEYSQLSWIDTKMLEIALMGEE